MIDLDQIASAHFVEQHTVAIDQEVPLLAGYAGGDMRIDQIGHAKVGEQSIKCSQIASGFPLFAGDPATIELIADVVHYASLFMVCFDRIGRPAMG
ncbi:hypothetical protein D3C81_1626090 [compost metagenome]